MKVVRIILLLVLLGVTGAVAFIVYFRKEEPPSIERIVKRVKIELPPKIEPEPGQQRTPPEVTTPPPPTTTVTKPEIPRLGKSGPQEMVSVSRPEPGTVPKQVSKKARQEAKAVDSWMVHIASFTSKGDAQSIVKRLKEGGYKVYLAESNIKGKRWYRVRIGFYQTEEGARTIGREISTKYHIKDIRIVKLGDKESWKGL